MQTKLVAQNTKTGLYFNGVNFHATLVDDAIELRPGTTSEDFRLMWAGPVEVKAVEIAKSSEKSLAQRIASGELTKYEAAREYVRSNPQKSYCVRIICHGQPKYVSRTVTVPKKSGEPVWIKHRNQEVALIWSRGELATDWA